MTVILTTAFIGADGTSWAAPWSTVSGTGTIQANRGRQATPGPGAFTTAEARANLSMTDGRVDATVRLTQVGNVSQRLRVRWDPATGDGYHLIIPTDYAGFQIVKSTAWSETAVIEDFTTTWSADTDYRVAFEFSGSTLRAKRWTAGSSEPGTWLVSGSDTTYTSGDIALATVSGTTGGVVNGQWADVSIDDGVIRDGARIGFHNDAFLAAFDDFGTYNTFTSMTVANTRAYLAAQTALGVPMGHESAATNGTHSEWPDAAAELAEYHFTFLNPDYHPDVLASWGSANRDEAARRLGYRLRLVQAVVPAAVPAGASMTVTVTIANDGYARPCRSRVAELVMVNGGTTHTVTTSLNVRDFLPGTITSADLIVTALPGPGTYSLYLAFPDPSASLATNPDYAIQLANVGMWLAADGRNDLNRTVTVTAVLARTASDTATASDAVAGVTTRTRATGDGDGAAAADSVATSVTFGARTAADGAGVTDIVTRLSGAPRIVTDTAAATDIATPTLARPRPVTDPAPATDSTVSSAIRVRVVSDSAGAGDTITTGSSASATVSDTVHAGDVAGRVTAAPRSVPGAAALTDTATSATGHPRTVGDTAPGGDTTTTTTISARIVTDTTAAGDDVIRAPAVRLRATTDIAPVGDAVTIAIQRGRGVTDSAAATDTVTRAVAVLRSVTDTAPGGDLVGTEQAGSVGAVDSAPAVDTATGSVAVARDVGDSLATGDITTRSPITHTRIAPDVAPATDTAGTGQGATRAVPDAVAAADSAGRSVTTGRSVPDGLAATGTVVRGRAATRVISDSAPGVDVAVRGPRGFGRSTADPALAADTVAASTGGVSIRFVSDGAPALDTVAVWSVVIIPWPPRAAAITIATVGIGTVGVLPVARGIVGVQ